MMSAAIAALCASMASAPTSYKYKQACEKAFEAGSIQSGLWKKGEDLAKWAEKKAKEKVPEQAAVVISSGYTLFISKEMRISTGRVPGVQSTAIVFKQRSVLLTLSWSM